MSKCPIDFRIELSYNWVGVSGVADYKEMYLKLFRATTKAADLLEQAQRECEEIYLSTEETKLSELPGKGQEEPEK